MKKAASVLLIALISAVLAIAGYRYLDKKQSPTAFYTEAQPNPNFVKYTANETGAAALPDFVQAAKIVSPAVVHINTTYAASGSRGNTFEDLFGSPQSSGPARASGSGVLITPDGYVVTNNHVIENASQIEVVLPDKRSFKGKLVGRDPSTDLALVKVDGNNLPMVTMGSSDNVQVGEWVLAVGYPLSLNSTVTAGIVSAKGRSIGILDRPSQNSFGEPQPGGGSSAIESFIQTDAAINPGNSGGALVNASGQLVGINAAIASQTGSYAGYGFAIPVDLVKKIVSDFRKYGEVRRGYLGVSFPAPAVEDQAMRQKGIDPASVKGVYITGVQPGSGAASAGLKEGDIIQSINGRPIGSSAEFSERIGRLAPGDKVELNYLRGKQQNNVNITLQGAEASVAASASAAGTQAKLGATFTPLPPAIKERYRLRAGLVITGMERGGFFDSAGIPIGTIITSVNGRPVNTVAELNAALGASRNNMVRLDGVTPDGTGFVFNFPLGA
jgi:serine protease Do